MTKEEDRDYVFRLFGRNGGTVEAVGITDDLKDTLEDLAPTGVTVTRDGTVANE